MKKLLTGLLMPALVIACICALSPKVGAATEGYYTYTVSEGNATITDCSTHISGDITIPDTLGGYPVTAIGSSAFWGCSALTSVTIGDSVTTIGTQAFYACDSLTSVTIGNSVTTIGTQAFYACRKLTAVMIPDSVITVGNGAFQYCERLPSITIGNSVTTIGEQAFYNCYNLTSVTIGNSVTTIGERAFDYCYALTDVYITDPYAWCKISFNDAYANPMYAADHLHILDEAGTEVTELILDNSITAIPDSAFADCDNLTSVTIPDNVTTIGRSAFSGCSSLSSVTIGDSVATIGDYVFSGCGSLRTVTIPDSVITVGDYVFRDCNNLTSVTIGDGVTSIGMYAFYYCDALTSVTIGDSVSTIGSLAFGDCYNLTNVYITDPSAWCKISFNGEFANPMYNADHLYILDKDGNEVKDVVLDNTVTSIPASAFSKCTRLTSISISNSTTAIGNNAFEYCYDLTSVTIPVSVTSIGNKAFYLCDNLKDIYYAGTTDQWKSVSIGSDNGNLADVTVHCNHIHNYSLFPSVTHPATCENIGYIEYTCSFGETFQQFIAPPLGHNMVLAPARPTSCAQPGLTAGTVCEHCQMVGVPQQKIPTLDHTFENGFCTECSAPEIVTGDLTGNGEIDSADGLMLMQYLNGWEVDIAAESILDVSGDGKVDSLDGLLLMRYLNNWDLTLN